MRKRKKSVAEEEEGSRSSIYSTQKREARAAAIAMTDEPALEGRLFPRYCGCSWGVLLFGEWRVLPSSLKKRTQTKTRLLGSL